MTTYSIKGFSEYYIKDKILYRKEYVVKTSNNNFQYRAERQIKQTKNNGITGYILRRNSKRKFYSLTRLRHRLKKQI